MGTFPNETQAPSLDEVVARHPKIPRLIALKIDVQRRGVHYTQNVLDRLDPNRHQLTGANVFFASVGARDQKTVSVPESLILRDGTTIICDPVPAEQSPYLVDYADGKFVLVDKGNIVEEVRFWEKPDFYAKTTSSGTPMGSIVFARPQRLNLLPSSYCHFWKDNNGCKYCDLVPHLQSEGVIKQKVSPQDAYETVREALKQKGRFSTLCITMGSDVRGAEPFDEELDYYIEILREIGKNFKTERFPSQVITTAFNKRQLQRLHDETGVSSYTADIEVLDEERFKWICPGKEKWVGYREWKKRLIDAVEVFGRGNVNTGIVGGVELAKPNGFQTEDEALEHTLAEAETLFREGVSVVFIVWVPRPNSFFHDQKSPSLEYYVRLAEGLQDLRVKYGLSVDFDDYRRCGNHPNADLQRVL